MRSISKSPVFVVTILLGLTAAAHGQYSTVTSPFQSAGNSFFEQTGVSFGVRGSNFFFEQNSIGQALPPFGGYVPDAGITGGFQFGGDNVQGFLGITASQGSRSSMTSQSPSVTLSNGVPGGFFDTSQTPFVVSQTPVVSSRPISPIRERLGRLQAGEAPAAAATSGSSGSTVQRQKSSDPWRDRLAASQNEKAATTMSVAEIRRLKAQKQAEISKK